MVMKTYHVSSVIEVDGKMVISGDIDVNIDLANLEVPQSFGHAQAILGPGTSDDIRGIGIGATLALIETVKQMRP